MNLQSSVRLGLLAGLGLLTAGAEGIIVDRWEYLDPAIFSGVASQSAAHDLAVDGQGVVYVAGVRQIAASGGQYEAVLSKLSSVGFLVWTVTIAGVSSSAYESSARAVALLPTSGTSYDVIVGGQLWNGSGTGVDYWLARYTPAGAAVWSRSGSRAAVSIDAVESIVVSGGTIFVAGRVANTPMDTDVWLAKFDGDGVKLGSEYIRTDLFGVDDAALALAADSSGGILVAGYITTPGQGKDIWVAKFTTDLQNPTLGLPGTWTVTISGTLSSTDYATGISVDASGDIFVVGSQASPGTNLDIWMGKISSSGMVLWTRTMDGGEGDHDEAAASAVDSTGNLYVTGYVDRLLSDTFTDVWLGKLTSAGTTVWEHDRNGTANDNDRGQAIVVDSSGDIYVAGFLVDRLTLQRSLFVVKLWEYIPTPPGPPNIPRPHATPNPFRPGSGGRFDAANMTFRSLPAGAVVRLYTLTGEWVAELTDGDNDGVIVWDVKNQSGQDLASGVYLYVVVQGSNRAARGKVVIIR